ncbi:hypothetical protein [Aeromicrobium alkaliterrae]|uniref:Uncharacterized protein n=1 Tax=Aeromicrobium alkaliterrae TaxID=302168 RepID=A0ABP4WH41_9ACTN
MNRSRTRVLSLLGAAALASSLTVGFSSSASANPPQPRLHSFATKAECLKAQNSPAYNNSYVRVYQTCRYNSITPNWHFHSIARA